MEKQKTVEQAIRDSANEWGVVASEYIVRVQFDRGDKGLRVYLRPSDRSGDTIDFDIKDNNIKTINWDE